MASTQGSAQCSLLFDTVPRLQWYAGVTESIKEVREKVQDHHRQPPHPSHMARCKYQQSRLSALHCTVSTLYVTSRHIIHGRGQLIIGSFNKPLQRVHHGLPRAIVLQCALDDRLLIPRFQVNMSSRRLWVKDGLEMIPLGVWFGIWGWCRSEASIVQEVTNGISHLLEAIARVLQSRQWGGK